MGNNMFTSTEYIARRNQLKNKFKKGIIIFLGNDESPMNFAANYYHYRQDSTFLYYWGLNSANLAAVIDLDNDEETIFGDERGVDDIVWMGTEESLVNRAESVGVKKTKPFSKLYKTISKAIGKGEKIHFLPQYRQTNIILLEELLGINHSQINTYASSKLIKNVIKQRSIKNDVEIAEIEKALDISHEMYTTAMKMIEPRMVERQLYGTIEGIALSKGSGVSFPIIFSVNGEILHNHSHENEMKDGQIALLDSGVETTTNYASDITRVIPVNGKFTEKQKNIYNIVLDSQLKAIEMMKPGIKFKEVHLEAAKIISSGLKELDLMKGDVNEAVDKGAHALFFPHGLGHMMGLDVHDMENLGENYVGYNKTTKRSDQFGLAYLRLGKELQTGNVVTVEPGIYFIPALIDQWKDENKLSEFINYDKVEEYRTFGGIRIEDDVLVTEDGNRILGKPIPKTIEEVEEACSL